MVLLFFFVGFFVGYILSLRNVKRPRRALTWGLILGGVPLALMFGPGMTPIQGIGSLLYFAFVALGPLMIVLFTAIGCACGVAGGAFVVWVARNRAPWVGLAVGSTLVVGVALVTTVPAVHRMAVDFQFAKARDARKETIMHADFTGTMAGHKLAFPASPLLSLFHNCSPVGVVTQSKCSTDLSAPVQEWTKPEEVLLHERGDKIEFRLIVVSPLRSNCHINYPCLSRETIDRWCNEYRADKADSIWCRQTVPMNFFVQTQAHTESLEHPTKRDEPELTTIFVETVLGAGRVQCYYHPDKTETDEQGNNCWVRFGLADGVNVVLRTERSQITSGDPALAKTIMLIPEFGRHCVVS